MNELLNASADPNEETPEILAGQYSGPADKLHIYLLIGQSNMAGRAAIPEGDTGVMDGCFLLDGENRWLPASNPINRYSTILTKTKNERLNPGYTFAITMRQRDPGTSIGLISNAKGATNLVRWMPGTAFYEEAVGRVKSVSSTGILTGVLWHQGEGNHTDTDYLARLKQLIIRLRVDLEDEELFFVAGGICESETSPGGELINAQLARLPGELPHTGFASSDGLDSFDGRWHFGADDMKILGRRYAEEMMALNGEVDR
jgi:hypothetical protein